MGRIDNVARNIEIKARAADPEALAGIAGGLADGPPVRLEQTDTFFHVPRGRLKLREFGDGAGELIQYARADSAGPKPSDFVRSPVPEPHALKEVLARALGVQAVVKKTRTLFLAGRTRIHLDVVAGLGQFVELEVMLRPDQTEAEGIAIAEQLMSVLGLERSDLVAGAYVDLLAEQSPVPAAADRQP